MKALKLNRFSVKLCALCGKKNNSPLRTQRNTEKKLKTKYKHLYEAVLIFN